MFRILKHHIDGLIFQYNFLEGDNVLVAYFSIELYYVINADNNEQTQYTHSNFTNCALADSSVCRYVSILVRFKFLDGMESGILVLALCFIDPAVSPRRDETKNGVFECDTTMSFVALGTVNSHHIMLYCLRPVVNHERKRKRSMMAVIRQPAPVRAWGLSLSTSSLNLALNHRAEPHTHASTPSILLL